MTASTSIAADAAESATAGAALTDPDPLSETTTWGLGESEIEALMETTPLQGKLEEAGMRHGEVKREGLGAEEERAGKVRWEEREMRWSDWDMAANSRGGGGDRGRGNWTSRVLEEGGVEWRKKEKKILMEVEGIALVAGGYHEEDMEREKAQSFGNVVSFPKVPRWCC